ncbi:PLC-like phosphodiesterase [Pisolithus marmoratus]|nr:PLC-like phosphodiesterase [Pisolithus marmoratus]
MSGARHDVIQLLSEHLSADTELNINPPVDCSIRLSQEVLAFLAKESIDPFELLQQAAVRVPFVDDTLPLRNYFVSSSHNTYLVSWQIFGRASAEAYVHVLSRNARCIEIDVWSSSKGPVVTHGFTLSRSVPFASVCDAIGAAVTAGSNGTTSGGENGNDWPVFVSLECHVPVEKQDEIVEIMKRAWDGMLVTKADIASLPPGNVVSPRDLKGRIVLMVEYYPDDIWSDACGVTPFCGTPILADYDDLSYEANPQLVKPHRHSKIADALADLGFYARSMKPYKGWEQADFPSPPYPLNLMLNVDETSIVSLMPQKLMDLVVSAKRYFRRVYPSGLRLNSSNLDPLREWQSGTQIACLNWQHYDQEMQLNEGLFAGTMGYVVKPPLEPRQEKRSVSFNGEIIGVSSLPLPEGRETISAYISAELLRVTGKQSWRTAKVGPHGAGGVIDLTWRESFEWQFCADELAFLRLQVCRSDRFGSDNCLAIFCARISQLQPGWKLIRLLNAKGKHTGATLLCRFTVVEA